MDSNSSKKCKLYFYWYVEDELLQLNGGKEAVIGWITEQIIEKAIELGNEIYKIVSKPKEDVPRSHSSGGRTLPKYGTPVDANLDWIA